MSELKAYTSVDIEEMDNAKVYSNGKLDCTRVYLKSDADAVIAELEESHKKEVEQLLIEIVELKEERRWRKFSKEKPTEEMEGMDFIVSNGFFHREISEWRGYWNNDPFCDDRQCDEVKYWRPLPAEPKEEKNY